MENLGDKIAAVAQPIAKGIDAVLGTNIQGCGGCKQMQQDLNQGMSIADAFYNRFWSGTKGGEKMDYIVNKTRGEQIAISATNAQEAMDRVKNGSDGQVISVNEHFSVSLRPGSPGAIPVPPLPPQR